MKNQKIESFQKDEKLNSVFLVQRFELRKGKNDKHFITLVLQDSTGSIDAKIWDANPEMLADFENCKVVHVLDGKISEYNEKLQVTIYQYKFIPNKEADFAHFLAKSEADPKELFGQMKDLLAKIQNPHLQQLRDKYMEDKDFLSLFYKVPAGVAMHHAYIHGLLEHTVSVLRLVDMVAKLYAELDRDLLVMAVFLHDSGKIYELSYEQGFIYTQQGKLIGHITLGVMELERKLTGLPDFPAVLRDKLEHCLLSHHGHHEFGSPKLPMFAEAIALHHLEVLDSDLAGFWAEKTSSQAAFGYSRKFAREMFYED